MGSRESIRLITVWFFCYTFFQSDLLVKGKGFYAKMQCLCDVSYVSEIQTEEQKNHKERSFSIYH